MSRSPTPENKSIIFENYLALDNIAYDSDKSDRAFWQYFSKYPTKFHVPYCFAYIFFRPNIDIEKGGVDL